MAREEVRKKTLRLGGGGRCLPRALEPKHGSNTTLSGRHQGQDKIG
jgi:hypothetical protein